ncbi:MAG: hypothetical protein JXR56_04795, partial [Candidatus Cloacimonetes bacterium]|nr:hypothetical protein [Candidatus Cloacimonadota bacterium]
MQKLILILTCMLLMIPAYGIYHKVGEILTVDPVTYICFDSDIAYINCWNDSLIIADVSNPESPQILSIYETQHRINKTVINDTLAYVIHSFGVQILNVSDPQNPVLLSSYSTGTVSSKNCAVLIEQVLYIATSYNGILLLDISDPTNPQYIGSIYNVGDYCSIQLGDNYAYVFSDSGELRIYDVSQPINPLQINTYLTQGNAGSIIVENGIGFLRLWNPVLYSYSIEILDLSDIMNIQLLQSYSNCDMTGYPYFDGDNYYSFQHNTGLTKFDASNLIAITEVAQYTVNDIISFGTVKDGYAYICASHITHIVDVSDSENGSLINNFANETAATTIEIGDYITFIGDNQGIKAYIIVDADMLLLLDSIEFDGHVVDMAISDNLLCVLTDEELHLIDVSTPENMELLSSYNFNYPYSKAIDVSGDNAFISTGYSNLIVIDISNPEIPQDNGLLSVGGLINDFCINGNSLYVTSDVFGFKLIDITTLSSPIQYAELDTPFNNNITVQDTMCYVTDHDFGLAMIDISDPNQLIQVNTILPQPTSGIDACCVSGNQLVVSDNNWNTIYIYDISDYSQPQLLDSISWNL